MFDLFLDGRKHIFRIVRKNTNTHYNIRIGNRLWIRVAYFWPYCVLRCVLRQLFAITVMERASQTICSPQLRLKLSHKFDFASVDAIAYCVAFTLNQCHLCLVKTRSLLFCLLYFNNHNKGNAHPSSQTFILMSFDESNPASASTHLSTPFYQHSCVCSSQLFADAR